MCLQCEIIAKVNKPEFVQACIWHEQPIVLVQAEVLHMLVLCIVLYVT